MAIATDSRNTALFIVGIVMAVGAAALMLWSSVGTTPLIVIGVIGVVFIAVGARGRRQS
ncbi:MAG: hypothetical protein WBO84_02890 [Acidimicrobiia bacterium]|jgi:hypothetical protein